MKSLESEMFMCNKKGECASAVVSFCLRRICSHCSAVVIIVVVSDNNKFNVSLVGSVQHKSSVQTLTSTCIHKYIYVYV